MGPSIPVRREACIPPATSDPLRHPHEHGGTAVMALERRISELKIQFERIAQLQAEWDILRIRFIKS
jgi:hypothetical protein